MISRNENIFLNVYLFILEEGSDTEILCNYLRRVQSQSLQPSSAGQGPSGGGEGAAKKRKKRRKRNKNRKNQQDGDNNEEYQYENDCASYWPFEVEAEDLEFINEDDPCGKLIICVSVVLLKNVVLLVLSRMND